MAKGHILAHPTDRHLVIADENLECTTTTSEQGLLRSASGSLAVEELLASLRISAASFVSASSSSSNIDAAGEAADLEGRVLALVRSANDGGDEVSLYKHRAHGFIPKVPLKKDKVSEMVAPFWIQRFGIEPPIEAVEPKPEPPPLMVLRREQPQPSLIMALKKEQPRLPLMMALKIERL